MLLWNVRGSRGVAVGYYCLCALQPPPQPSSQGNPAAVRHTDDPPFVCASQNCCWGGGIKRAVPEGVNPWREQQPFFPACRSHRAQDFHGAGQLMGWHAPDALLGVSSGSFRMHSGIVREESKYCWHTLPRFVPHTQTCQAVPVMTALSAH